MGESSKFKGIQERQSHGPSFKINNDKTSHTNNRARVYNVWLQFTHADVFILSQTTHTHTHTHTHTYTHRAMLSPNVINAVKRLTSGYLFKSRHQTHSFFFFISTDHRSYCQGRKAPSDQLSGQLGQTRPALSAQLPRSLSSFTEGACRASAVLRQDKAAHCQADNGQ